MILELLAWALVALLFIFIVFTTVFIFQLFYNDITKGAPFVPNDNEVIKASLNFENHATGETKLSFLDLGSGDGRVLIEAAKKPTIKHVIGYEISILPYLLSQIRIALQPAAIKKKIKVERKNIFNAELDKFDVIYAYLLPNLLKKIVPGIKKAKRKNPALIVISPVFKIEGLKAIKTKSCRHEGFRKDVSIYYY